MEADIRFNIVRQRLLTGIELAEPGFPVPYIPAEIIEAIVATIGLVAGHYKLPQLHQTYTQRKTAANHAAVRR